MPKTDKKIIGKNISISKYKIAIILILGISLISMAQAVGTRGESNKDNNSIIVKDSATDNVLLTIQPISVKPDLVTMEEIFKITSHEDYTFDKIRGFNARWEKDKGKKDIIKSKWEILENVEYTVTVPDYREVEKNITISNIISYVDITNVTDTTQKHLDWGKRHSRNTWELNTSNGTGTIGFDRYEVITADPLSIKFSWNTTEQVGNHQEAKYREEWKPFSPDGKKIKKDESYTVKLTLYKEAEVDKFSIKTTPMLAGVESSPIWWNGSWNYRIDNPIPSSTRPYQLLLNISNSIGTNDATHVFLNGNSNADFSDIRFTLDNTTVLPYWIEDSTTGKVWVNVTANGTVNLYYGNPSASDSSDGKNTFEFFDDFTNLDSNPVLLPTQAWESGGYLRWGSIAYLSGAYYIYYTNSSDSIGAIGRATSTDLIHWTKNTNNPIISNAIGPSLLKELDGKTPVYYNNKYWMLTMKADGTAIELRSAASLDSNTWTLENSNLIPKVPGTWYENYLYTTSFVRENDKYYIVMEARNNSLYWNIGYLSASSPNGPYINEGVLLAPTLPWEGSGVIDPVMRKFGSTYYLFYTGNDAYPYYNNSYATSSSLAGPYTKSQIQLTPLRETYPEILQKDQYYYILTDDHPNSNPGKNLYRRMDLNGPFGSPFDWNKYGSPTVSNSELLLNSQGEYIRSSSAFLYKAMKIRAKYAPLTAVNSYQYFGFEADPGGGDLNAETFFSYDTPDLKASSGNSVNTEITSIYSPAYFGSYHNYEILWRKNEAKFIVDNALKATHTTYVTDTPQPIGIYDYMTDADLYVDWVFIRNYVSPEPSWEPWSAEQTEQPPVSYPVHNLDTGIDYPTIQAAIDASQTLNGHRISVDPGTYRENINVYKSLAITGSGFSTVINGSEYNAIAVNANNVGISGFTVTGSFYGIYVNHSNDASISANNISNNLYGIRMETSSGNLVQDNTIFNNSYSGLSMEFASANKIVNNTMHANGFAIYGLYSDRNNMSSNYLNSNVFYGIFIDNSANNNITDNSISNNPYAGLALYPDSNRNTIINNSFKENGFGVYTVSAGFNTYADNYINNIYYGIYLDSSNNNTLGNNKIEGNPYSGLALYSSSNGNTITGNNLTNNGFGAYIYQSDDNNLSFNNFKNIFYGAYLDGSYNNLIQSNEILNNPYAGLAVYFGSEGNQIKNNNLTGNGFGIYAENSSNNSIYHNNLISNSAQAYDSGVNIWNSSYPGGGNHWSDWISPDDYSGPDQNIAGSDGMVDIPYAITGGANRDKYPLVSKV